MYSFPIWNKSVVSCPILTVLTLPCQCLKFRFEEEIKSSTDKQKLKVQHHKIGFMRNVKDSLLSRK